MSSVKRNNRSHDIRLSDKTMHIVLSGNFMFCLILLNSRLFMWMVDFILPAEIFFLPILWAENCAKWIQDWNLKSLVDTDDHGTLRSVIRMNVMALVQFILLRFICYVCFFFRSFNTHEIMMFKALIVMSYFNEFEWNVNEHCFFSQWEHVS